PSHGPDGHPGSRDLFSRTGAGPKTQPHPGKPKLICDADDTTEAALAAGERITAHTTRFGGKDVTAQVQSWELERSYATDLLAAMRAFSGSSAAQLQVQLSSTGGKSAPELYSPWAARLTGDIARPGQSVVHESGLSTGPLPAFRGTVRSRSAASGTDSVQVTALDGAAARARRAAEAVRRFLLGASGVLGHLVRVGAAPPGRAVRLPAGPLPRLRRRQAADPGVRLAARRVQHALERTRWPLASCAALAVTVWSASNGR
ncbi:hypothetical protein ABZY09_45300, partial [Streptomyces sp. NPDC002928]